MTVRSVYADRILVVVKTAITADPVRNNHVQTFVLELGERVLAQVLGLRREANRKRCGFESCNRRENVFRSDHVDLHRLVFLLYLLCRR